MPDICNNASTGILAHAAVQLDPCPTQTCLLPQQWRLDVFAATPAAHAHSQTPPQYETALSSSRLIFPAQLCRIYLCLGGKFPVLDKGAETVLFPGECQLCYIPDSCTHKMALAHDIHERSATLIVLTCPGHDICRLLGDSESGQALRQAMHSGQSAHIRRAMTTQCHETLAALQATMTHDKPGSELLLMGKILEVIWHFAHADSPTPRLPPETMRALEQARLILEANMEAPPDLGSLATQVGMSLSKLKQVFPLVHGMPPYALLRQARMAKAIHLIRHEGRSVTEAALEVGYSNLSHFSRIFSAHFGHKPSQLRRQHIQPDVRQSRKVTKELFPGPKS